MNTPAARFPTEIEPLSLGLPETALQRLRQRLGRGLSTGEALDASSAYGAPADALAELVEYWFDDFELEGQPLFGLPCFRAEIAARPLCFVHARSVESFAVPVLLLHGYSASLAEFQGIVEQLANPCAHGANPVDAFHVVCPSLPGFGYSGGETNARATAESCAALMRQLGYSRYVVHGSDLGANVALELAALDAAHVAGLHVIALPAYPAEDPFEQALLTSHEKSQLARLSELYEQQSFQPPESAIEELALSLANLADAGEPLTATCRDTLLTGLTLSWALTDSSRRSGFYRTSRLAPAPASTPPVAVHCFPLDAPNLRRFAERGRRVVQWTEHEHGGGMPALERPTWLVKSLRDFFADFR
jgi:pimeloyl-ACP methyl ester carboxylesterase